MPKPMLSATPKAWEYEQVCFACANAQREKVVIAPIPDWEVFSCWEGICDHCQQLTGVAHPRDFGRPWHKPLKNPVEPA
jgi:hypothetical protein